MNVYTAVRAHHVVHGDDFGTPLSRQVRYNAAVTAFPGSYDSVLDVGCGSGQFEAWIPARHPVEYNGIDLLTGTNVLDYDQQHDVVVALGVFYKLPYEEHPKLLEHMWKLAKKALIVQTITRGYADEYPSAPGELVGAAWRLTPWVWARTDYLPNDVTVGLYRC